MPEKTLPPDALARLLVFEARRWVGITEIGGDNRGQMVEMFQRAVDGKASGEPWCAAFAFFCIEMAESTAAALGMTARSPLHRSEWVQAVWEKSPERMRLESPEPGCLIVWQKWKNNQPTPSGHIGIVLDQTLDGKVVTIEGNTGDGEGVQREGDGVFSRVRSLEGVGSMRVRGFLRVFE